MRCVSIKISLNFCQLYCVDTNSTLYIHAELSGFVCFCSCWSCWSLTTCQPLWVISVISQRKAEKKYPIYSCRTHQRAITLGKIIEPEHAGDMHIHLPYLIFPWSFNEIRLVVSENSRGHEQYPIYSCRTHQRAITLGKIIEPEHAGDMRIHLWYLIFPWSFIEILQAVSENLRGQEHCPSTLTYYKDSRPCPTVCQYQMDAPVTRDTQHLRTTWPSPLGVISRLCSETVALPRHLLYYCSLFAYLLVRKLQVILSS